MAQLTASTTATKHIFKVLKAIGTVSNYASLTISDQGLKFTVDTNSNSCQAHLFLTNQLFSSYEYNVDSDSGSQDSDNEVYTTLTVNLSSLISCLQMFSEEGPAAVSLSSGSGQLNSGEPPLSVSNSCRFIYEGPGHSLMVFFKEGAMTTKCELTTYQAPDTDMIELLVDRIDTKIIIKGEILLDALKELESLGTEIMTIRTSLHAPHFVLTSKGQLDESQLTFPNEKSILDTFIVEQDTVVNSYHFNLVSKAMEAVRLASKVSIRCDENGIMSIQSMCEVGDGRQSFIDFRLVCCSA